MKLTHPLLLSLLGLSESACAEGVRACVQALPPQAHSACLRMVGSAVIGSDWIGSDWLM